VPFLQAVFCLKGFDDRSRFFSTSMITLLSFIFFSAVFSGSLALLFAILLILTTVLTCSTKRRLHDAQLTKNWQLVPGGLLLLTGILSLVIESSSSYYLLVLPLLSTALLLTYPSKNKKSKDAYIFGYYGPVDLSSYIEEPLITKAHSQRIEPTLASKGVSEQHYINENISENNITPSYSSDYHPNSENNSKNNFHNNFENEYGTDNKQADIGELIRLKFLNNRKFQLGIIATVSLIFIGVFVNSLFNAIKQPNDNTTSTELNDQHILPKKVPSTIIAKRSHLLEMPDNFNLYLSEYKGIIIHWQADQVTDGELWSLSSAIGDKSCQSITFNKGSAIRPLAVVVEKGSEYFASFSPIDSGELIQALAFRGKFTLCGYSFSLKGTQAILGKHNQYAPFLETDN